MQVVGRRGFEPLTPPACRGALPLSYKPPKSSITLPFARVKAGGMDMAHVWGGLRGGRGRR